MAEVSTAGASKHLEHQSCCSWRVHSRHQSRACPAAACSQRTRRGPPPAGNPCWVDGGLMLDLSLMRRWAGCAEWHYQQQSMFLFCLLDQQLCGMALLPAIRCRIRASQTLCCSLLPAQHAPTGTVGPTTHHTELHALGFRTLLQCVCRHRKPHSCGGWRRAGLRRGCRDGAAWVGAGGWVALVSTGTPAVCNIFGPASAHTVEPGCHRCTTSRLPLSHSFTCTCAASWPPSCHA